MVSRVVPLSAVQMRQLSVTAATSSKHAVIPITVAHGDGIGPEIMASCLRVLDAAGANLEYDTVEIGENVYNRGLTSGIEQTGWDSLARTKVLLKAPITTPLGGGVKVGAVRERVAQFI